MALSYGLIVSKYGDVPLRFSSYRSGGEFTFRGRATDGTDIRVIYGHPQDTYNFPIVRCYHRPLP